MSTKRSHKLKQLKAAGLFKYVPPFSGHQAIKGYKTPKLSTEE